MRFFGQRWRYLIGNSEVNVDNAFSWQLWGQERLMVNGETVQAAGAWLGFRWDFSEPWMTLIEDAERKVILRSSAVGISCGATMAGEKLAPDEVFEANWYGSKGSWPDENQWAPAPSGSGIRKSHY